MKKNLLLGIVIIFSLSLSAQENFLIVADQYWQNNSSLNDFCDWKTEKGFTLTRHFCESGSTVEEIDSWVEEQYDLLEPVPKFLLLIGDAIGDYSIPTQTEGLPDGPGDIHSDLVYGVIGEVTDLNRIPAIFVGRFSCNNETELSALVNKTLWYEKEQYLNAANLSYLSNALGVSNNSPDYADHRNAVIDYGWDWYFNDVYYNPYTYETNGINGITLLYPHADTLALVQNIKDEINYGTGFYYYIGNSDAFRFKYPDFTIADLEELSNFQKYPVVMGGG
jgi:Peptidase family C25